ncbi:VF_A0006 family four-cysteine protein [Burkholderia sp. PU8-34]
MSWCARSIAIALLAMPAAAYALTDSNAAYDQCVLQSLRDSWSSVAARIIQQSCDALYRNGALLLPRERAYHECVVQSLPGVRDNFAIQQIMSICSRRREM